MIQNTITCSKCGKEFPATTEYFYKLPKGNVCMCKKCVNISSSERYKRNFKAIVEKQRQIIVDRGIKKYLHRDDYQAYIYNPELRKMIHLGTFKTFKEAKNVFDKKEKEFIIKYRSYYKIEDLPNEKWKDIMGYEGEYMISNLGRVKNVSNPIEKLITIRTLKYDRKTVRLIKPIKQAKTFSVARLMAIHFVCENLHKKTLAVLKDEQPTLKNINYVTKRDVVIKHRKNKYGYAGVRKRENGRFRAVIDIGTLPNGKQRMMNLGTYDTAKEAGEAYLKKKFELEFGNMKEIKKIKKQ